MKVHFQRAGALLLALVTAAPAMACAICVAAYSHDFAPFSGIFFYIALAWLPIAITVDLQQRRLTPKGFPHTRSLLGMLLILVLLGIVTGLLLLAGLYVPYWLYSRYRTNRFFAVPPPQWARRSAGGALLGMLLLIPVTYLVIPKVVSEHKARQMTELARDRMRTASRMSAGTPFEPADPFSYQLVRSRPLKWLSLGHDLFIRREGHDRFARITSGSSVLLVSRGVNGTFDTTPEELQGLAATTMTQIVQRVTQRIYDPTNGSLSPGDVFYAKQ